MCKAWASLQAKYLIKGLLTYGVGVFLGVISSAFARPEYAAKEKVNCIKCHATPWGGGPRTVFGKAYGSHGHMPSKLSLQDLYYGDMRFIGYQPEKASTRTHGIALMEAAVSGNVPIIENEDHTELRALLTYNMAPLGGSMVREAWIRWQFHAQQGKIPIQITFGRMYVPFGYLTDEHRTYTRIQTNMTLNNFSVGGVISGNFSPDLHYDFGLVNDFQSGGSFVSKDITWGSILNLRWNPENLPFLLGVSGNYQYTRVYQQPLGSSIYGILSLDRLTQTKLRGSLVLERVDARNWNNPAVNTGQLNPSLFQFFIPTADNFYQRQVIQSSSVGYLGQFKYFMNDFWVLFYKFDYLALDKAILADVFIRHGFGVEVYPAANLILNVRVERAAGMRPNIASSDVLAAQNDIFGMFRLWL